MVGDFFRIFGYFSFVVGGNVFGFVFYYDLCVFYKKREKGKLRLFVYSCYWLCVMGILVIFEI